MRDQLDGERLKAWQNHEFTLLPGELERARFDFGDGPAGTGSPPCV
jgi:hypothetical protein